MDLEAINNEYTANKTEQEKLQKMSKKIERLENDIETLKQEKVIYEKEKELAVLKKDKTKEADATKKIEKAENDIAKKEENLNKAKLAIDVNKKKLDNCINLLSKNPEFKKHMDTVMKKKFARQSEKVLKENEELKKISELINQKPECQQFMSEMKKANINLKKLNQQLEKLDPVKDASKIATKQSQIDKNRKSYNKNKDSIKKLAKAAKINIDENILKEFVNENSFKIDKQNSTKNKIVYNVESTINHKIKANEKTVRNNEIALSGLEGKDIKTKLEERDSEENIATQDLNMEIESRNLPVPQEKPKWYQFIKRFKNWRQNRKMVKEQSDVYFNRKDYEKEIDSNSEEKDEKNEFRNSLKFDIVKDYAKQYEKEIRSKAKDKRKEENDNER